jgi:two-component system CheB/CheR fusion protein
MTEPDRQVSHVVVVGSSAGGIESLSTMLDQLPRAFPAAVVIAQHISPTRESALMQILARHCELPVANIEGTVDLAPGTVYVVPQNRHVEITDHQVRVHQDGKGPLPSIDLLFSSAARAFGETVIAVVLSGTGSDGAAGARDVKYAGGTVVIQDPDTAAYPGMPLSLAPSIVDIMANPERIGGLLNDLVTGAHIVPAPSQDSQLRLFLEELREQSGIDFSSYKQATIERRLQRRMIATGASSAGDYIRYVREHPEERRRLIGNFLIKVTEFFRDPELFTYLREQVLPELARRAAERDSELRLWSAGCATGEEAYSLAMTVRDALAGEWQDVRVKIFATDLDEQAVSFARRGIYPARALSELPPDLRDRHFGRIGDDFEVRKELRGMIVFGEHDLAQRAPFPRIDLILCRNVLIYFTPALQRRALQLFAFSLQTGGYLVLGKSETVSPLAEYFTADHARLKVFRRVGERAMVAPVGIRDATPGGVSSESAPRLRSQSAPSILASLGRGPARDLAQSRAGSLRGERLLLEIPVGIAIVNQQYDVQHINTEARRLFGIHTSALNEDLIHQIRHFDALALRDAVDAAGRSHELTQVVLTTLDAPDDARRSIEVTCRPIPESGDLDEQYLVLAIADVTDRERLRSQLAGARTVLERLTRANEEVIAANQQLTQTVSRLRAENDDLLVAAEEIQAATEEVETLNEELQASNEELETLNEELQATVEELNTTNDDLQNRTLELQEKAIESETLRLRMHTVLDGLEDAIIVVDPSGSVVVGNAAYRALGMVDPARDMIRDADGQPFIHSSHPLRRAAEGETFEVAIVCGTVDGFAPFTLQARQVTSSAGERFGVVTLRADASDQ